MSTVETIAPSQENWDRLPNKQAITRTIEVLKNRGINPELVDTHREALRLVTTKIPDGAQIMTGASTTLDEIGFTELLKSGAHKWKNLK